jgi:hypothetical protein
MSRALTPLNLKHTGSKTWPPPSQACATLFEMFCVVGRNDFLARLGMVHDRLIMREISIKPVVDNGRSDEGVYIANVKTVQVEILA